MTTLDALEGIHRLRYKVYCDELGFLDASQCPDGQESDPYDPCSIQIAARDSTGALVGTLRLVLDSPLGFPLEAHAGELWRSFYAMRRANTAEISRLIVDPGHRGVKAGSIRHLQPVLMLLFRTMYEVSMELGLEYWVAAMEPTLHRTLRHLIGVSFDEIGLPMDYHGEVVPYGVSIRQLEQRLARTRQDTYRFFGVSRLRGVEQPDDSPAAETSAAVASAYDRDLLSFGLERITI